MKKYEGSEDGPKIIKKWVNEQTYKEGFTPLHFSSFRGNLEIIKKLLKIGADMHIVNHNGINVLHVAAQGDQAISLVIFHFIHFKISQYSIFA
jgi:ankyrin repeat protein